MAEATDSNWIRYGDRSHPNLKLIDEELRYELTYEGHYEDLERLEEAHLSGRQLEFDGLLFCVREKQRIHEGDRSHPRLVELDSLRENLSYNGWQKDFDKAFETHLNVGDHDLFNSVERMVEAMKRKQSMSLGDHTHENLVFLNTLHLSFPGWQKQVEKAVDWHRSGFDIDHYRFSLVEKQRMFEGDRSHPRLVALDALNLTYPGWQKDATEVEKDHLGSQINYNMGVSDSYKERLQLLSGKQIAHESGAGQWLHPVQSEVLEASWSYPGWQADIENVRSLDSSTTSTFTFEGHLEKCQLRQMFADNNYREHPALKILDELQLCYPGWETDFEDAKNELYEWGYGLGCSFERRVRGMTNKQAIFSERPKKEAGEKASSANAVVDGFGADDSGTCVICFEAKRTHIFVPCGHVCACKSCSAAVMNMNKKCPICKNVSQMVMEMYFP